MYLVVLMDGWGPQASLAEMIAPGALVILTPVVVGTLFGTRTLSGLLAGSLVSGVQMAVSMSNTGGAWDNAKKYVEVRDPPRHDRQPGRDAARLPDTANDAVSGAECCRMLCLDGTHSNLVILTAGPLSSAFCLH